MLSDAFLLRPPVFMVIRSLPREPPPHDDVAMLQCGCGLPLKQYYLYNVQ